MPFPVGSRVVVLPLGRKQGVVVGAGRAGHYRVQVENATIACRESDLAMAPEPRRTAHARARHQSAPAATRTPAAAAPRLDLHGATVEEALARLVDAIDAALRQGADRLEAVHGKGSGRLRDALHRHLKTIAVVASFKLDPKNPGVTWIYF